MKRLLVCLPLLLIACNKDDAPKATPSSGEPRFEIAVTDQGFVPADVAVPGNKPVTLVFTRKTDQTCAKQVVLETGDGKKIERDLPLDAPIEIAATFPNHGKLTYACGMNMVKGTVTVQ